MGVRKAIESNRSSDTACRDTSGSVTRPIAALWGSGYGGDPETSGQSAIWQASQHSPDPSQSSIAKDCGMSGPAISCSHMASIPAMPATSGDAAFALETGPMESAAARSATLSTRRTEKIMQAEFGTESGLIHEGVTLALWIPFMKVRIAAALDESSQ